MTEDKIAVKLIPTPATHDISQADLLRLSRITSIPVDRIRDRISRGKGLTIITAAHPKVQELVDLIRSIGFSVVTGPPKQQTTMPKTASSSPDRSSRESEDNEWAVGEVIENLYEVKDIKHGGMGAVYVVHHRRWNTMLAVKSLLKKLQDREEDRSLFLKEAETWIDIGFHPNIAACYYVRNIRDSPRIFIEYVDGGPLNQWLNAHQPVGWDLLIDLMVQFCDGLAHAHAKGLVHRDVKPGNCMMTKGGTLKVTDFGLTKRRTIETGGYADTDLTTTGSVTVERESITAAGMGTPGYMAPEMWIPHAEVGPPADIYAFGVMFFELCCGRKPFVVKAGEKRDKLAYQHVKSPPPQPRSLRKDIPKPIEGLILKCLSKSPDLRYASFHDVRETLEDIYEHLTHKKFPRERPDEVRLLSDALNNRAVSLMDLNHKDEALMTLKKALESDPHHPEAVYNRGLLEWFRTGDPNWDLVVLMEEVVKSLEYQGRGSYLLGRCLLTLGDALRALKACEMALSSEEASEDRLKPYALALIGCGREQEAIEHLERYLKEIPTDEEAAAWLIGALVRTGRVPEARARLSALAEVSEWAKQSLEELARSFVYTGLGETLVLQGHTGWVTAATHSPVSNLLLTASRDRTLRVWDATTGTEQRSFSVMGQPPVALRVSPDERLALLVFAQSTEKAKVLDLVAGRFIGTALGHEGAVTAMKFSEDGRRLVTVDQKGPVRIWDCPQFRVAASFKVPLHSAAAVMSMDPEDPEILVAGMDRSLKRIRPASSGVQVFDRGHRDVITSVHVRPQGDRAMSCGRDRQVIVWDTETGKILTVVEVHQEQISAVALNPVRELAASYDPKTGIKLWDIRTGMVQRTFGTADSEILTLEFTADGDKLLAGGKDMTLRVWDVRGRYVWPDLALAKIRPVTKQMKSDRKFNGLVEKAKTAMKNRQFGQAYALLRETHKLAGYERSDIVLDLFLRMKEHGKRIGVRAGWKRKSFETQSGAMDVKFSPSAINFLTAQADHTVRLWSVKSGDCLKILKNHTNLVAAARFSVNGREAASGGDDRSVRIWDLNTGRNVATLDGHRESVSCLCYSPDGTQLLSGSWDRTIRLWRLSDSTLVKTLKGHEDRITAVAFVADADYVFSAGWEGAVKMWDLPNGRIVRELRGHTARITSLTMSPLGDLLLSTSMDGTARLWHIKKGRPLVIVEASPQGLRAGAFSPDQRFFATGGDDTVVRIWDAETGSCHREFQGHAREITAVDFASHGRFLTTSCLDGTVILWELDWEWDFAHRQKGYEDGGES
jgi:WD40 repeat protein